MTKSKFSRNPQLGNVYFVGAKIREDISKHKHLLKEKFQFLIYVEDKPRVDNEQIWRGI